MNMYVYVNRCNVLYKLTLLLCKQFVCCMSMSVCGFFFLQTILPHIMVSWLLLYVFFFMQFQRIFRQAPNIQIFIFVFRITVKSEIKFSSLHSAYTTTRTCAFKFITFFTFEIILYLKIRRKADAYTTIIMEIFHVLANVSLS